MNTRKVCQLLLILFLSACGQVNISVDSTPTPAFTLPDLIVSTMNVSMVDGNGRCAGGYYVFASILNQGNTPAEGVTVIEMSSGNSVVIGRLEAGQKIDLQMPAISTAGPYILNVDPQNMVDESNETNNNLSFLLPTPTPFVGCMPVPANDATPTPVPLPTFAPPVTNTDGLIYADMNLAQISKLVSGGQVIKLMDGINAHFLSGMAQAIFEQSGDLWLKPSMDGAPINLTNTPDLIERNPQWWGTNPAKIVFNVVGNNEAQEKGWTQTYAGYVAMINTDGSEYIRLTNEPSFGNFALSPDGTTIAYDVAGFPNFYVLGSGQQSFQPADYGTPASPLQGWYFFSPSFSPESRRLTWWIAADETRPQRDFMLDVFDLTNKTSSVVHSYIALPGTLGWLEPPTWSFSGQWFALQTRGETTLKDLWILNVDGNMAQRVGLATNPIWSPYGDSVAFVQWPPQADSYLSASLSIIDIPSWNIHSTNLPAGSVPLLWVGPSPLQ